MPFAKALSSNSDGTSHGVADPLLIDEELRYRKEIPVNQFVEHMLYYSLGDRIDHRILEELCDAKETRGLLDEFCSQADQTNRHEPFANLANHFLDYRNPSGLTSCRNDLTFIQDSVAERKPDVVLVSTKSPQFEYGAELARGPEVGFYWNDVYCSVEFTVTITETEKEAEAVMRSAMHYRRGTGLNYRNFAILFSSSSKIACLAARNPIPGQIENEIPHHTVLATSIVPACWRNSRAMKLTFKFENYLAILRTLPNAYDFAIETFLAYMQPITAHGSALLPYVITNSKTASGSRRRRRHALRDVC
ncbi:hypothetical protein BS47DRAFT_1385686 [Hydnum rufescens UP504]|uniref:Uncharacterized protein n=1 Tax=Hydnum rufescens UP504 TaxID=1448309 RepID=A0A9P6DKE0_9AGAM|nr:hypothetical protein BS47DRAFT_1385686 [Hydnum rufescens UP504]